MLLRKAVYPYEYMVSWERFDETSLPEKNVFYSELYLEDITDKDYGHAQKVFEEIKLKNLGDYHVFGNFRNKCIEINKFNPAHFLSAPGLA